MYEKFISSSAFPSLQNTNWRIYTKMQNVFLYPKYKDKSLIIRHQIHVKT